MESKKPYTPYMTLIWYPRSVYVGQPCSIFNLNFSCDIFLSSPTGRQDMPMARESWRNVLNAQLFNSQMGGYFRMGFNSCLKLRGFFVALFSAADFRKILNHRFMFILDSVQLFPPYELCFCTSSPRG